MEYKVIIILTFAFLLELPCQKNKDPDEDRAYEFGFTIDGQQHRHEKKDANGIIQGEFGFITADGIYHVTVYATDENGDFKILSMKNIRVSPPLDGSPGPGPGQTKLSHGQNGTISQPHKRTDTVSSTQRTPFTTLPTIKPACAGCGYVTTQKPLPGQKFSTLTPFNSVKNNPNTLQNQQLQTPNIAIGENAAVQHPLDPILLQGPVPTGQPHEGNTLRQQSNVPTNAISGTSVLENDPKQPNQLPHDQNVPQQAILGSTPEVSNNAQNQSPQNNEVHNRITQPPSYSDSFSNPQNGLNGDLSSRTQPNTQHTSNIINRTPDSPGSNPTNPVGITVSNGAIHVPGNPDIPIKDKYPGMVDGLPPGIEQKDIKDILYKFNYTVGFHGHYETGYKNGAKIGGYFVNGRDGISRIVTYVADENGFRPKVKFINLGLDSPDTPKEDTEKTFGLKNFEFVWYPLN